MKPFKAEHHNMLEERELLCSLTSLYSAIYFVQDDHNETIGIVLLLFIFLVNCYFYLTLMYCFI